MKKKRLRLVKVTVIPQFVVEDGEDLSPLEMHLFNEDGTPLRIVGEIPASEWPDYATNKFTRDVADLEARLNSEKPSQQDSQSEQNGPL